MAQEEETVAIYETEDLLATAMLKGALEQAGIPFSVANDVVSSIYPTDGMLARRFEVFVRDAERARQIVRNLGLT